MKNKSKYLILLALLIAAITISCGSPPAEEQSREETAIPVKAKVYPLRDIDETVNASGKVEGIQEVQVIAEVGGTIMEVDATLGRKVNEGDIIAVIDDRTISAQYKQAESQLEAARNGFEQAKKDYQRYQRLFDEGNVSSFEFEQAEYAFKNAKASLKMAEAGYETAAKQYEDTRIKSPIDGYITYRYIDQYQLISPGTPVADIVNDSKVLVKFGVSTAEVSKLKVGQKAKLTAENHPEEEYKGYVKGVSRGAERTTLTYPVEVEALNASRKLKSGMLVDVSIIVDSYKKTLAVPSDIFVETDKMVGVYVVENGKARFRTVSWDVSVDTLVIVEAGITDSDTVVYEGENNLTEGAAVRVVSARVGE
ncbi:MAG: efflux RND transporter periplasmic adaptor subunit [candidate division Zixibacteria bacterium]|nr:efflux RND transporter periplasmic adaptor subunit [candidate division Zixibacteria bacterium]